MIPLVSLEKGRWVGEKLKDRYAVVDSNLNSVRNCDIGFFLIRNSLVHNSEFASDGSIWKRATISPSSV